MSLFTTWLCNRWKAQSPVLAELYGRGVHAFNNGDLLEIYRYLTMALMKTVRAILERITSAESLMLRPVVSPRRKSIGKPVLNWRPRVSSVLASVALCNEFKGRFAWRWKTCQLARIGMCADQSARNQARYNELRAAESEVLRGGAASPPPAAATPPAAVPPAATPPPSPEVDNSNNPFGNNAPGIGQPVPDSERSIRGRSSCTDGTRWALRQPRCREAILARAAPANDDPFGVPVPWQVMIPLRARCDTCGS
ncbi:MAG: hypothetical protein R3C05_02315 [Pirellulaceae bacterium]